MKILSKIKNKIYAIMVEFEILFNDFWGCQNKISNSTIIAHILFFLFEKYQMKTHENI